MNTYVCGTVPCVEVTGQLAEVRAILLPCGTQAWNSGCQPAVYLSASPSYQSALVQYVTKTEYNLRDMHFEL